MESVAAVDSPETRAALFRALVDGQLLALTPDTTADERSWTTRAGEAFNLVTLQTDEGEVLPVFTRPERMPQGGGYVAFPVRGICDSAAAAGVAGIHVNPGSRTQRFITRTELEALARGRLPLGATQIVSEPVRVRVGRPANPPPPDVIGVVSSVLAQERNVVRAWLFLMVQDDHAPEMCIGVELASEDEATTRTATRAVAERTGALSPEARELAFLVLSGTLRTSVTAGAGDLIYQRQATH